MHSPEIDSCLKHRDIEGKVRISRVSFVILGRDHTVVGSTP